ncbi:hypothetical protein ADICYQ_2558 [Cyclobacterium qasimii M12-11B]|uniref:Uncharacterized protein n=1 Tax=Cyclobacterium qasimii M12-11B TaxID=641524 RepID=S7WWS6_9BACT|nr:hypothetical protein ADICYQ_2558 [Cyclobacterium qasimii M12-11B]
MVFPLDFLYRSLNLRKEKVKGRRVVLICASLQHKPHEIPKLSVRSKQATNIKQFQQ